MALFSSMTRRVTGQFAGYVKLFEVQLIAAGDFGEQLLGLWQVEARDFEIELWIGSQLRQQAREFVIIAPRAKEFAHAKRP